MKQMVVDMDWTDFFLRVVGMVLTVFSMLGLIFWLLGTNSTPGILIKPASSPISIATSVLSVVAIISLYPAFHQFRSFRFVSVAGCLAVAGPVLLWLMGIQSRIALHRASTAYCLLWIVFLFIAFVAILKSLKSNIRWERAE